jgi:D-alanyl-D-alanine carboxypeptidase (penicillin-binding protein 5/6)
VALALGALPSLKASDKEVLDDFVRLMNAKALELDLKNTYFWNETGLDESVGKGGAYGTTHDFAMLLEYIMMQKPGLMEATQETQTVLTSLDNHQHLAKNTNLIAKEIPGLLASKTGYTDIAGGNLAFVFDPEIGRPIIVTILGSSALGRFEDAKILIVATLKYINGNE